MKDRTDQQWLDELRQEGSVVQANAYTDLYQLLFRRLCNYIRRRSRTISMLADLDRDGHEALAEDFAQDALLRIMDNLGSYKGTGKFTSWTFVIANNVAGEAFRRKRWSQELPANAPGSQHFALQHTEDDSNMGPEKHAHLQFMLDDFSAIIANKLTQRERTSLILYYLCGWKSEEIARYLNSTSEPADRTTASGSTAAKVTSNSVIKARQRGRPKIMGALVEAGYDLEDMVDLPAIAWESVEVPNFKCPEAPSA